MRIKTKEIVVLGMLTALAFTAVMLIRIPIIPAAPFLDYEPKDALINIGGFIFGPLAAALISVTVALVEMVTISATGGIGFVMNSLSSCAFTCTAAYIYSKNRTRAGAVIGLIAGGILMTTVMLLWNYLVTPIFMGIPREFVAQMLVPVFLPFNLIKSAVNASITMLLYKPVVTALRKARLVPEAGAGQKNKFSIGVVFISLLVIATCILFVLAMQGLV